MTNLNLMTNDIAHKILYAEDASEESMLRLHVTFLNGYCLSIVKGETAEGVETHGNEQGLLEIAVLRDGGIVTSELIRNGKAIGGNVVGWQTKEDVRQWAIYVANLPKPIFASEERSQ